MIRIEDPDDPRVEPYRAVRDRDLVGRRGLFIAEGDGVVRTLLGEMSRFTPLSVLVSEARVPALGSWLDRAAGRVPVLVAPQAVMDRVVGFPIHRGLLALGAVREGSDAGSVLPPPGHPALVLGLIGISNHDNVGGAFRNAAAFGVDAVLLDAGSCDPLYRKAIRVSVGSVLQVPFARAGAPLALVATLKSAGFETVALSPGGSCHLQDHRWANRTALLVGSEGEGLPPDILARVPSVRIGMAPNVDSLNVATACGIALHAVRSAPIRTSARPVD